MKKQSQFQRSLPVALALMTTIACPTTAHRVANLGEIAQDSTEVNPANLPTPTLGNIDCSRHFKEANIEGSILIYSLKNKKVFEHNPQRNATAFPVASTFKILNSLIALEAGAIASDLALLTWDGIPRMLPPCNQDLNLREAYKHSAVWFYQVLARRVGYAEIKQLIKNANYGNQNVGDPADIDQFWLNGNLQITPQEQVSFLRRLYENDLPFSERSLALVKDIMIAEKTPNYTLRAKTGWYGFGQADKQQIGWYVGYVETPDNVYFFATNLDLKTEKQGGDRLKITRLCLQDLGIL